MMQGDPLSPTVFNVAVDAVIRHWDDVPRRSSDLWSRTGWGDMAVELSPFRRHFGEGHSGWGWWAVHYGFISSPQPDPCLLNKVHIRRKERFYL